MEPEKFAWGKVSSKTYFDTSSLNIYIKRKVMDNHLDNKIVQL